MIAKNFRLTRGEIAYILKKGLSKNSKLYIIRYVESERPNSQYAVTTSTRISNKAVERNLIRRRTYESIRLAEKEIKHRPVKMVLIPKKQILKTGYDQIKQVITSILKDE